MAGFPVFLLVFIFAAAAKTITPKADFWGYMYSFQTAPQLTAFMSGLMLSVRSLGGSSDWVIYQAVFGHGISKNLVLKIAATTLPWGIPELSSEPLIGTSMSDNTANTAELPCRTYQGLTPEITAAAGWAVQEAYKLAFSYVWVATASFAFVALVGKSYP
ncbi:uncharacterized protein Z518_02729 [Rhinocladiella mackenziei CBS 650.93]|uniref:Uncharacterized protein n=1 Tax=Rhinocladiella mackenziei CBS 650.93 TaxID=1442369 RepID=A0A0D2IQA5_9EURO|nr:uncharacterized protein Z518_02729 [Rhinocladiella mackenziei CBS 650.93]KIX08074.1 hypothetical protein Z518_02729 [Rhinocladiella mackenziei CBS 650.93]